MAKMLMACKTNKNRNLFFLMHVICSIMAQTRCGKAIILTCDLLAANQTLSFYVYTTSLLQEKHRCMSSVLQHVRTTTSVRHLPVHSLRAPLLTSSSSLFHGTIATLSNPFSSAYRAVHVDVHHRRHLVFGANTNVGKTIVTTGLIRASRRQHRQPIVHDATNVPKRSIPAFYTQPTSTHYVKPLQCGRPLDSTFVDQYNTNNGGPMMIREFDEDDYSAFGPYCTHTIFAWDTPTSPHTASRIEQFPVSDSEFVLQFNQCLEYIETQSSSGDDASAARTAGTATSGTGSTTTWIETAGGVLSPASASPHNITSNHARQLPVSTTSFGPKRHRRNIDNPSSMDSSVSTSSTSPVSWGWIPQGDLYQPYVGLTSVVLVGDSRLGGIHATLTALESLVLRGYNVHAVVFIDNADQSWSTQNVDALREYISGRKVTMRGGTGESLFQMPTQSIVSLPPIPSDPTIPLYEWYNRPDVIMTFSKLNQFLLDTHQKYISELTQLKQRGRNVVWWPFTQHGNILEDSEHVTHVDSAHGDYFSVLTKNQSDSHQINEDTVSLQQQNLLDACASWWTQGVGHGNPSIALAAGAAAGRYGHVLFPDVVHQPAVRLSEYLISSRGPGYEWASRVFFSDDGSTAMEVAIKMGIKLYQTRKQLSHDECKEYEFVVCAQAGCYHGDTLGVMDVAEPSIFNEGQHPWYKPMGLFLDPPTIGFQKGVLSIQFPEGLAPESYTQCGDNLDKSPNEQYIFKTVDQILDVDARKLGKLYSHYSEIIEMQWLVYEHSGINRKIASVVFEPILLGAGGMKFIDPLWQRALVDVARSRNIPVIFDEVASGLYRLGVKSCREILGVNPDIAAYAKLLTGGLIPLSATLASEEVFSAYLGTHKGQALLHGHSFTAHPLGCVSALHALDVYHTALEMNNDRSKLKRLFTRGHPFVLFDIEQTRALSELPAVERSFTLGTVLAVTFYPENSQAAGYGGSSCTIPIVRELRHHGVYTRPLGNVIYLMASPLTCRETCENMTHILQSAIIKVGQEAVIEHDASI
jgi:bifunctional dethiobiotin synthetase / adenosylmethionine---8-amino-7-oxononanoate aminotransferase